MIHDTVHEQGWLLFFYSVPSKPVSGRMKVWRKLLKSGAVPLKGAVYVLPFDDEHYEFLQWLVSEITAMNGEAAFVKIDKVESTNNQEIIDLFNRQRARDYKEKAKALETIERRLSSTRKGGEPQNLKDMAGQFARLRKEFEEIQRIDFFSSHEGRTLSARVHQVEAEIRSYSGEDAKKKKSESIPHRSPDDYRGKTWITRKRPFVDRMASAWLIRRFIAKDATFDFMDEKDMAGQGRNSVAFDVGGGEFTHIGELCTFEVLMKAFGLRDKIVKTIAEIVHDLDMKDGKYKSPEAKGLEDILSGIRKTAKDDQDMLDRGMAVFEMLYVSKS